MLSLEPRDSMLECAFPGAQSKMLDPSHAALIAEQDHFELNPLEYGKPAKQEAIKST